MSDQPTIYLEYGETYQTLEEWGFGSPKLLLKSRAISTFTVTMLGGDPASALAIPFEGQVKVFAILAGGPDGGEPACIFAGRLIDAYGTAGEDSREVTYVFGDAWYDLLHTVFQHYWTITNGSGGTENVYFSRLNLFQDISAGPDVAWVYLDAKDQLAQIIDYAADISGVLMQAGTIDPVWDMPIRQVQAISCAEAILEVLRPMPDTVTYFDYLTTPPTLYIRQRANLPGITLPWASTNGEGTTHKSSNIKPRPDLQAPQVVVQYQKTITDAGASWNETITDVYPPASTGVGLRCLVLPIDLRGAQYTTLKGTLETVAIDPTSTDFWQVIKPDLNDPNIVLQSSTLPGAGTQGFQIVDTTINGGSGHPDGITIETETETVDLTDYPNKLLSGQPASWMKDSDGDVVEALAVTIRATLKYTQKSPGANGQLLHKVDRHVVETRVRLTNAPAGTTNYSISASADNGDPALIGLAYFLWCSINNVPVNYVDGVATPPEDAPAITAPSNLQWEGSHTVCEQNVYQIIGPGNVLNLSGPGVNTDWEDFNAPIASTEIDFFSGRTVINFGPHQHLTAQEFWELLTTWAVRHVWDNPSIRNSGQAGTSGAADIGGDSPKENTTHQNTQQSIHTVIAVPGESGSAVQGQHDANTNGGQIVWNTVKNDGTIDTTLPQVQLSLNDLGVLSGVGRIAKWNTVGLYDSTGAWKQAQVACSAPEPTTIPQPSTGGTTEIYGVINTASGNPEIYANYFVVNITATTTATWTGSGSVVQVASAVNIVLGVSVSGTNIPGGTTVAGINGSSITLSASPTGALSGNYTFAGSVRVAKVAELCNPGSYSVDGTTFTCTYGASSPYAYVARLVTATISGNAYQEYQVIEPRFVAGAPIWFIPVTNAQIGGVTSVSDSIGGSGTPITYLDTNKAARGWCYAANQAGYE